MNQIHSHAPPTGDSSRLVASILLALLAAVVVSPSTFAADRPIGAPSVDEGGVVASDTVPSVTEDDYSEAEQLLEWNTEELVAGDEVDPEWIHGSSRFWYVSDTVSGHRFVYVDPGRNVQRPLFDHHRLAAAMSTANDTAYTGAQLPFEDFEFVEGERVIGFEVGEKRFECDIETYSCTVEEAPPSDEPYVLSPDSTKEAFVDGYDLYVRSTESGDTTRITEDGTKLHGYGLDYPSPTDVMEGDTADRRPEVEWAPDSRHLLVSRNDQRGVEHMHYISYTPQRPEHYSQPYALPGDTAVTEPAVYVADTEEATARELDVPEYEPRGLALGLDMDGSAVDSVWSEDSEAVHLTTINRGSKKASLVEIDVDSGESRVLVTDSSQTFVEISNPRDPASWYVTEDGETAFWWSERDGWGHLYRVDAREGGVTSQVTSGPWQVGAIHHVDEERRTIWFTARGRDQEFPYHARLYRVNWDGSGLRLLTPEEANHEIDFSPRGDVFVDTYSDIARKPTSVLRRASDGEVVRTLEEADVSRLEETGWQRAERFRVKARDGETDIWGVIYLPPDYDPEEQYPVIDHIYPGPQVGSVGSWTFKSGGEVFALAELGFVVVEIDHMGTPLRSKQFHDTYYGHFIDNGLPDHVTAIKQLGRRYEGMDLDRVGIYGHSGGGFASTDAMLRYPDFFDVAVSGAGNHDNRSYNIYWAEKYQGIMEQDTLESTDIFRSAANKNYAEHLEGDLLLMHGDMDDNVHPANTIQLADALIEENKDFDLIIAPDEDHGLHEPYYIRRRWDYFVENLMGATPPEEYRIEEPQEGPDTGEHHPGG